MTSINKYPGWKNAVEQFLREGFKENDLLTYEWLHEKFMLKMPTPTMLAEEAKKIQFEFMTEFKKFETHLLIQEQIALRCERSYGYRIVPSQEQTDWAWQNGVEELRKATKRMSLRVENVDILKLTDQERIDNANASARIGALKILFRNKNITQVDQLIEKKIGERALDRAGNTE